MAQAKGDRGSCPRSPCTLLCTPRHISRHLRPPTSPGQPRIQGLPQDVPPGAGATKLGGACSLLPPLVTGEDTVGLGLPRRGSRTTGSTRKTSVQSLSCVRLFVIPQTDCSTLGFPVHHQLPELAQTHVHRVGDAIQPSHPLSFPSPPAFNLFQHQGLFQCLSSLHQVAKLLTLQLQHQSFRRIFRTDFP